MAVLMIYGVSEEFTKDQCNALYEDLVRGVTSVHGIDTLQGVTVFYVKCLEYDLQGGAIFADLDGFFIKLSHPAIRDQLEKIILGILKKHFPGAFSRAAVEPFDPERKVGSLSSEPSI